MLNSRVLGAALSSFLLGGCLSGQTGSPDCVAPTSCVCDSLFSGGELLRVHSEAAPQGTLVAVVDEVLGSVYDRPAEVRVGDRIGGSVSQLQPCGQELGPAELEGKDLFVLFIPGREGGAAALLNGELRFVLPGGAELDFGADHRIPSAEAAAVLTDPNACLERFPYDELPPCNDTTMVCSVSRPSHSSSGWPWLAATVGLALGVVARRRARR